MNITEPIIIALISGLCVAVPSIITTLSANKKSNALVEYKINELTKKVERHNQVIERVYELEKENSVQNEEIKVANHRINDLENRVK